MADGAQLERYTDITDLSDRWDESPSDLVVSTEEKAGERIGVIRTSDRLTFLRCRRRWAWSSHLRSNLAPKEQASPLWMGSGFHFALEDFHGLKRYASAADAFDAYVQATKRFAKSIKGYTLPGDFVDLMKLSRGMLTYYTDDWLGRGGREPLTTFVYNGVPQTEVNFRVELPWEEGRYGYDRVMYSGTIDRVSIDEHGFLWGVEYKSAKAIQTLHYDVDTQVSAYCWALANLYGLPVGGIIYQQHLKKIPNEPKLLSSGKLSTDKAQLTTAAKYRDAIVNIYGSPENAPESVLETLHHFQELETPGADRFVRRDWVERNQHQIEAQGTIIMLELADMLNPDLPLYPSPDRTCTFMCPFHDPCVALDSGNDWEYDLQLMMAPRPTSYDGWRKFL